MTRDASQPLRWPVLEREARELGPLLEWVQPLTTAVVFDPRPGIGSLVAGK